MFLEGIVTHPDFQGRGYGGALLEKASDMVCSYFLPNLLDIMMLFPKADAQNRAIWLISGNIQNTAFYNSHGYFTVGIVELGKDDPTWKKAPVQVPIVGRVSLLSIILSAELRTDA